MSNGVGTSNTMDPSLRYISVRTQWGCQPIANSIATVEDKEFLMAVGCRLSVYDEDQGVSGSRRVLYPGPEVESIISVDVSSDKKYIAACVRRFSERSKATVLVYDMDTQRSYPKPPRAIKHSDGSSNSEFYFSAARFSQDSKYLACYSSRLHVGVVIYDWRVERHVSTIIVKSFVTAVSFNPSNSTRLCTSGACGLFQFWHFTQKSTYSAPISGFTRNDVTYTCHAWVGTDCVVTGTDKGTLHLVVGCEAKGSLPAFGLASESTHIQAVVTNIITKGNTIIAYSVDGYVSVSKLVKGEGRGGSYFMKHESYFLLQDTDTIYGMTWVERKLDSMTFAVGTVDSVKIFLLPSLGEGQGMTHGRGKVTSSLLKYKEEESTENMDDDDDDSEARDDVVATPPRSARASLGLPPLPRTPLTGGSDYHQTHRLYSAELTPAVRKTRARWPYLVYQRVLTSFHSGGIVCLSTSPRCSLFATASVKDATVKVWDYNRVNDSLVLSEDFSQRQIDMPNTIDMHPSGYSIVTGNDTHMVEYAITDAKLEVLKRVPVKVAITGPTGEPVMNTSPVSIVKYSHGGNLIAVVTGRLAQLFEVYNFNYNTERNGTPERMITLTDHVANISDITFSQDDSRVFTCAVDGAVYEWKVGRSVTGRENDYYMRNVSATRISISPSGQYIIAAFESEYSNARHMKAGNRTLSRANSESDHDNSSRRPGILNRGESGSAATTPPHMIGRAFSSSGEPGARGVEKLGGMHQNRSFLVMWKEGTISSMGEEVLELNIPVTAVSFGRMDGRDGHEMCVLGLANGDIVVSMLPIPLKVFVPVSRKMTVNSEVRFHNIPSSSGDYTPKLSTPKMSHIDSGDVYDGNDEIPLMRTSSYASVDEEKTMYTYDESLCRVFSVHEGSVTRTLVSASGLWIFSTGVDGCVFMLNTNLKAKDQVEVAEAYGHENHIILTDKAMLKTQQARIEDKDLLLEEMKKDKKHTVSQLEEQREKEKRILEETMAREIAKRDDIIVVGRTELQQANKKSSEKLEATHKAYRTQLAELEVMYEKKLAHESLYLQNMKQAYDEYVTHARMDLESFHRKASIREEKLHSEKDEILEETEKQKKLLLEYCDYVGERHREVLRSLTETHDDQKYRLNLELEKQTSLIDQIKNQNRQDEAKTLRQMQLLRQEMQAKEMEALNTAQELERMKDRASRLEAALQNAMAEISRKTEAANRWEFKAGEQQQNLSELERVRKALVSQLHTLREEMGPKDLQIVKTSERLNEVDKEYDKSLKSISEKEEKLIQSSNMVHLLHKQVRELRSSLIQKEGSLKRAAKLLDEFKYALQQARFSSRKITVQNGGGEADSEMSDGDDIKAAKKRKNRFGTHKKGDVLELISSTPVMEESLQRLHDVLNPHSTSEDVTDEGDALVIQEKERQIDLMRRNINSLRTNIKFGESVATKKVHNYLTDNEHLLYEMNQLRHEVGYLREENERLHAAADMRSAHKSYKASVPLQKGRPSRQKSSKPSLPDFPLKRTDSEVDGTTDLDEHLTSNISMTKEEMLARAMSAEEIAELGKIKNHREEGDSVQTASSNPASADFADSRSSDRADRLISELMTSNKEQIMDSMMKESKSQPSNGKGSGPPVPIQNVTFGKDKKSKAGYSGHDHRVGPAVRKGGKIGTQSVPNLDARNARTNAQSSLQSMTMSQLPKLVSR